MHTDQPCRVLAIVAHPDDAEIAAGGLLVRHSRLGSAVRVVSATNGQSGHHAIAPEQLIGIRREEARRAGAMIHADYVTLDFPDGYLQPDLTLRAAIIEEIRRFGPDLVLTHRPNDYHPDHRAVGQVVQDASYMVTVPHVCPKVPALRRDPVVAYVSDLFTRPNRLRVDFALEISKEFDQVVTMAACHRSQFFEWLPYHDGILHLVPDSDEQRIVWLGQWLRDFLQRRWTHFHAELLTCELFRTASPLVEVYEVSEYAARVESHVASRLFPECVDRR